MSDIPNELRAACAAIIKRHYGLPGALAAIKLETVERIDAYINHAEARLSSCKCQAEDDGFTINTRADRPWCAEMIGRRLARMRAEDEAIEATLFGECA